MSLTAVSTTVTGSRTLTDEDRDTQGSPSDSSCPRCGFEGAYKQLQEREEAQQRRIEELEAQTRALTEKAAIAAEKLADYEDGLQTGRAHSQGSLSMSPSRAVARPPSIPSVDQQWQPQPDSIPPQQQTRLATLASYLPYGRRSGSSAGASRQSVASSSQTHSSPPTSSPPPQASNTLYSSINPFVDHARQASQSLQGALDREQALRKEAESRLTQANTELEELSAELFMRANEMVATERRERAKLEERVQVLERRDKEKRTRLERLEKAVARVERVKGLIGEAQSAQPVQ